MKKVLLLLVGLGLVISCDKEEALDDSSNTFDTTSIMALIESGNNDASRDVNRPGSVLDFINTIEITADHVGDYWSSLQSVRSVYYGRRRFWCIWFCIRRCSFR